jgi:cell shape-determining protein MreD
MGRWLLILLAVVMVVIMVAYWGSIGSAVMAFGLIELAAALLYKRFLNRDRSDIYE